MICISIPEKNIETCLELINSADMAEIRIDKAGFDESEVRVLFSKSTKPLIATCRPELVEDSKRLELLKAAIEAGAAYVDIEIESHDEIKNKIIQHARSFGCKVIISYHNYVNTPSADELNSITANCFDTGADIVKIATTAVNDCDCARILGLYDKYTSLVALAMGETGRITRVANLFLGSAFTFASISDEQKTAQGQLTVTEMKTILKNLYFTKSIYSK